MVKISVIVLCYYPSEYARRALTMLSWQTKKEEMEVVLVNNCSPNTDCDYQDLVQEFSSQLNLRYLKTEKSEPPGIARQYALNTCHSQWVMFHDDDDILNNAYIIEAYLNIINQLSSDKLVAMIGGNHYRFWFNSSFEITSSTMTGQLYNINFLRLCNIQFNDTYFEEDTHFHMQLFYWIQRSNVLLKNIEILSAPKFFENFIGYTKMRNSNSICETLSAVKDNNIWTLKALAFINSVFDFYLSIPNDNMTHQYLKQGIPEQMEYFCNFIIPNLKISILNKQTIEDINNFNEKVLKLLINYKDYIPSNIMQDYNIFINHINKGENK